MQIYLTNLGKYNEGHLMGEWVKLPVSEKEFKEMIFLGDIVFDINSFMDDIIFF